MSDEGAATTATTTKNVGVGIVGFGRTGAAHARWLARAAGIRAVAVAETAPSRREAALAAGLRVYDSIDALVSDAAVDAVFVATPTVTHFEHARRALEAGRHVMVDRPVAATLAEARWLVQEAAKRKRVLTAFHDRRWDLDFLTVKAAVESRSLGKLINVESRLALPTDPAPVAGEAPTSHTAATDDRMSEWATHLLDQLWRLLWPAKPLRVFAQFRPGAGPADRDDFARVCVDFENDIAALVEVNATTPLPVPRWRVDGSAGSAFSAPGISLDPAAWADLSFSPIDGGPARALRPADPGLIPADLWSRFGAAVRGQGLPAVSADSVLPATALLDAARESAAKGRSIDVRDLVQWVY